MDHPPRPLISWLRARPPDERGVSLSAFVATVVVALLAMGGLVIDGGALSNATRQCQQVAAEAARAATDAGAERRAAGLPADPVEVRAAARAVIATYPNITGDVTIAGGQVTVKTRSRVSTTFLSLIRINSLDAEGHSSAILAGTD